MNSYEIKYIGTESGDYRSIGSDVTHEHSISFNKLSNALHFLNQCTYPLTQMSDLCEELKEVVTSNKLENYTRELERLR